MGLDVQTKAHFLKRLVVALEALEEDVAIREQGGNVWLCIDYADLVQYLDGFLRTTEVSRDTSRVLSIETFEILYHSTLQHVMDKSVSDIVLIPSYYEEFRRDLVRRLWNQANRNLDLSTHAELEVGKERLRHEVSRFYLGTVIPRVSAIISELRGQAAGQDTIRILARDALEQVRNLVRAIGKHLRIALFRARLEALTARRRVIPLSELTKRLHGFAVSDERIYGLAEQFLRDLRPGKAWANANSADARAIACVGQLNAGFVAHGYKDRVCVIGSADFWPKLVAHLAGRGMLQGWNRPLVRDAYYLGLEVVLSATRSGGELNLDLVSEVAGKFRKLLSDYDDRFDDVQRAVVYHRRRDGYWRKVVHELHEVERVIDGELASLVQPLIDWSVAVSVRDKALTLPGLGMSIEDVQGALLALEEALHEVLTDPGLSHAKEIARRLEDHIQRFRSIAEEVEELVESGGDRALLWSSLAWSVDDHHVDEGWRRRIASLAFVGAYSTGGSASGALVYPSPGGLGDLVYRGLRALVRGRLVESESLIRKARLRSPDSMQAGIAWCVWNLATRNWDDALETLEEFGGKESHVITFHACCVALGALREIGGDVWGSLVRTYAKVLLNECGFEATTDRFVIGCRALVATCLLELNELDMGRLTATLERDEETISARASSTDRFLARRIRMTRQELRKRLGQK